MPHEVPAIRIETCRAPTPDVHQRLRAPAVAGLDQRISQAALPAETDAAVPLLVRHFVRWAPDSSRDASYVRVRTCRKDQAVQVGVQLLSAAASHLAEAERQRAISGGGGGGSGRELCAAPIGPGQAMIASS